MPKQQSAIRVNLTNLSNALSDDTTVFDDVFRACSAKRLITDKQAQEYTTNTAGNTLRAVSLVNNIMTIVGFVPEELHGHFPVLRGNKPTGQHWVTISTC